VFNQNAVRSLLIQTQGAGMVTPITSPPLNLNESTRKRNRPTSRVHGGQKKAPFGEMDFMAHMK